MSYESVLKKFESIQFEINTSNHDRMKCEDYEADDDEITECLNSFGLERGDWMGDKLYLPESIWTEAFGEYTEDNTEETMNTPEYKNLAKIYTHLYDQIVQIATEISAYYSNEAEEEEKYYNSIRYHY
jgi:hypothetical protein